MCDMKERTFLIFLSFAIGVCAQYYINSLPVFVIGGAFFLLVPFMFPAGGEVPKTPEGGVEHSEGVTKGTPKPAGKKKLSETKREVAIGRDRSVCCNAELRQRQVYPFQLACTACNKDIVYEENVLWGKQPKEVRKEG